MPISQVLLDNREICANWTIVFDLDGTLVDTAPDLLASLNQCLIEAGFSAVDSQRINTLVGQGARAMIERGLALQNISLSEKEIDILFDNFLEIYTNRIAEESRPFPGVIPTLGLLHQTGFRLAVCTNKLTHLSERLLDALAMGHYFSAICGRDSFTFHKPDGRHIIETVRTAKGNPQQCLMVGDSKADISAAQSAHIPVIAVSFGYGEEGIENLEPDVVIDTFDGLIPAIDRLTG